MTTSEDCKDKHIKDLEDAIHYWRNQCIQLEAEKQNAEQTIELIYNVLTVMREGEWR